MLKVELLIIEICCLFLLHYYAQGGDYSLGTVNIG